MTNCSGHVHRVIENLFPGAPCPQTERLAGRLRLFTQNWQKLSHDPFILNIVEGWKIPFSSKPTQSSPPRQFSHNLEQRNLISEEVTSMLRKGAIVRTQPMQGQVLSNIFLREKKEEGKYRPIINLKGVNKHIPYEKFKMESLKNLKSLLREDDYMVKIDLKDAYFCIPLDKGSRKYVRFEWGKNLYEFVCLMFGLGPGPKIFTKMMKVPVTLLRKLKIRLIIYIDDMLLLGATMEEILTARDTALHLLRSLGLVINMEKSILEPSRLMEFLGVMVNSRKMTLSIPREKMEKLIASCRRTLTSKSLPLRKLAQMIGKLQATAPAFTYAPLQIRYLQQDLIQGVQSSGSYESMITLSKEARMELEWWIDNITLLNGNPIRLNPPDLVMSTDAAKGKSGGWGAECQGLPTRGTWKEDERHLSINMLELLAAKYGLKSFLKNTEDKSIHLKIDNTTALSYLAKMGGTHSIPMMEVTKDIWSFLRERNLSLTLEYVPSKLNVIADWQSRNWRDSSEWKLNTEVFNRITSELGTPDVDLFASRTSHQMEEYFSWMPDPESIGTDALCQNWDFNLPYAFPPFCLIGQCLKKVRFLETTIILITPIWVSQTWYPHLLEMSINRPLLLPSRKDLLRNPKGESHPLIKNGSMRLAAWLVSGRKCQQRRFQTRLPRLSGNLERRELELITTRPGESSVAGVVLDRLIPFHAL